LNIEKGFVSEYCDVVVVGNALPLHCVFIPGMNKTAEKAGT